MDSRVLKQPLVPPSATSQSPRRRLPIGAEVLPGGGGVHFRVWAPKRRSVAVVLENAQGGEVAAMKLSAETGG